MRTISIIAVTMAVGFLGQVTHGEDRVARVWVSTQDMKLTLTELPVVPLMRSNKTPDIVIQPGIRYQRILGMGASLEPTTCFNLSQLSEIDRDTVMTKLADPEQGIGMNLMRICIGTPDFTGDPWYSYCDLPEGQVDKALERFSIAKDRDYIIPVLKLALAKNPKLLFIASPWSPPGWMKSTGSMIGGFLLPEYQEVYARYFVRFIEEYAKEGIPIHAVTVQNEPGVDRSKDAPRWHYPSCLWTGEKERDFIKNHLGPAFEQAQITTEIWCYDHNYNEQPTKDGDPGLPYPRTILQDPIAATYVKGVAFHGYAGQPSGMSLFHEEFPEMPIYFTEGSMFGTAGAAKIVALLRHSASSYNAWVTMIDTKGKPNNGPFRAFRTSVMRDAELNQPKYLFDYYMYGQFMKFVQRGAVRIDSGPGDTKPTNVAFQNPDGKLVLVLVNPSSKRTTTIGCGNDFFQVEIPARSVITVLWSPETQG